MARRSNNNLRKSANDIFKEDDNNPFKSMYTQSFGNPQ